MNRPGVRRDRSPIRVYENRRRDYSPSYQNMSSQSNRSQASSLNSQHLWKSLDELELFPSEFHNLLKNEDKNLTSFKTKIEREKMRVAQDFEAFKKEVLHNIEDLKLSINAELDNVYKFYMEKYGHFKGELMDIKRMRDEVENDVSLRKMVPLYQKTEKEFKGSNASVIKSMENHSVDLRKLHILSYITELQKEKILPLTDLSKDLVILTNYDNNYYQAKELSMLLDCMKEDMKMSLRSLYDRKYQFIRDPNNILDKEERPILEGVYDDEPTREVIVRRKDFKTPSFTQVVHEQPHTSATSRVSASQQSALTDWAENIQVVPQGSIKSIESAEIILCALEVRKNQIAVGGKDGGLIIYDAHTGARINSLRGHKKSVCSLALVNHRGRLLLASGSDYGCSAICLWDTNSWTMNHRIETHRAAVTSIVDLQDGLNMVSGSYDKRINIYNLDTGKIVYNLPANKSSVLAIIMNASKSRMVSCGLDNSLTVWQIVRNSSHVVETMFFERIIENNTMICALVGSLLHDNLIFVGAKDGKIKLVDIEKGQAYKTVTACNNSVIQMLILERQSKPDFPFALCWPQNEECVKIVNTETGRVTNVPVKGIIEFGCGIGPKCFFFKNGRILGMLSQSESKKEVNFFKVEVVE